MATNYGSITPKIKKEAQEQSQLPTTPNDTKENAEENLIIKKFKELFAKAKEGNLSSLSRVITFAQDHFEVVHLLRIMIVNEKPFLRAICGLTECHISLINGDFDACKKYLRANPSLALVPDFFGLIPLYDAIASNNIPLIEYFENELGIKTDTLYAWRDDQVTLLHQCAMLGNSGILKKILLRKPNLLCRNMDGDWPIINALDCEQREHLKIIEMLYHSNMNDTYCNEKLGEHLIHNICSNLETPLVIEKLKILLKLGQQKHIDSSVKAGYTPLLLVFVMSSKEKSLQFMMKRLEVAQNLLEHNANINIKCPYLMVRVQQNFQFLNFSSFNCLNPYLIVINKNMFIIG